MKGFSKSISNRFTKLCKPKNQYGEGSRTARENSGQIKATGPEIQYDEGSKTIVDQQKFKKRSKKHKKRKLEYQNMDY